jgi:hypothetical protein
VHTRLVLGLFFLFLSLATTKRKHKESKQAKHTHTHTEEKLFLCKPLHLAALQLPNRSLKFSALCTYLAFEYNCKVLDKSTRRSLKKKNNNEAKIFEVASQIFLSWFFSPLVRDLDLTNAWRTSLAFLTTLESLSFFLFFFLMVQDA